MVRSQWLLLWVPLPWLIMLLLRVRVLRLRVLGPMLQVERPLGVPRLRLRVMLPRVILDKLFSYIVGQRLHLLLGVMLPLFNIMLLRLGVMLLWSRVMRLWLIPGLRVMLLGTGVILNQLLSQILGQMLHLLMVI